MTDLNMEAASTTPGNTPRTALLCTVVSQSRQLFVVRFPARGILYAAAGASAQAQPYPQRRAADADVKSPFVVIYLQVASGILQLSTKTRTVLEFSSYLALVASAQ